MLSSPFTTVQKLISLLLLHGLPYLVLRTFCKNHICALYQDFSDAFCSLSANECFQDFPPPLCNSLQL